MGFAPIIFFAFVPLLILEQRITVSDVVKKSRAVFGYSYLSFFIWNAISTWWIWNATAGGAIMAIAANSLLMSLVFLFYHKTKNKIGHKYAPFIFSAYWISFEYLHLHWDISWTWLNLGNVFSNYYNLVQWYEYTGVFGGALWIIATNFLVLRLYDLHFSSDRKTSLIRKNSAALILLILVPVICSVIVKFVSKTFYKGGGTDVVIVQPNIDPYNEKFSGNFMQQLDKMLQLALQKVDSNTSYLVFPETALTESIWENDFKQTYSYSALKKYVKKFPRLKIIIGANTWKAYEGKEKPSLTARKFEREEGYYDVFNTAIQIDNSDSVQIYHKSKLVPGVEKMPFPQVLGFLESLAIKMGGSTGSLGVQDEPSVFYADDKRTIAPIICYESIYGGYVGDYVNKSAGLLFIITNDGWWGDTPGYKQHLSYASLRAIETRRWIARSANTGISCFINPQGEATQQTAWWQQAVVKEQLYFSNYITFYTLFGDYIAFFAVVATIVFAIFSVLPIKK
jgi:apolipoprotein N-acyltransferase